MAEMPTWTDGEEFVNSLTHGICALILAFGSFFLMLSSLRSKEARRLIGNTVFCLAAIELYTVSMIYHALEDGKHKRRMRFVDHISVSTMIAGSYTAFVIIGMKGESGYPLLTIVWILTILGSFGKIFFFDLVDKYSLYMYVALGWLAIFSVRSLVRALNRWAIFYCALGGLFYRWAIFYWFAYDKPFAHAVFHVVMFGGTLSHMVAIGNYL
jgi:hemolysin III